MCKACEVDTYSDEAGRSSKADCKACSNDRSTGGSSASTNESSCLCKEISTIAELMALVSHALMEQIVPARMDLHSLSSQHYQDSGGPEQRSKYLHLVQKDTAR